jgi:succinate dehydrogenase/fumarate reductase flavoprotein subunit
MDELSPSNKGENTLLPLDKGGRDFKKFKMDHIKCDVLIMGGGGAGLRAAIEAKETFPKGKVLLITKGLLGKSGVTATACSDRMAFHATLPYTEPGGSDNWKYHAEDIYRIGGFVSDGDLAFILAREAREAFEYLDRLGVPFVKRSDGRPDQFITDGSEYARACYTGPRTANHMEEALLRKASSMDIGILNHCMMAELITYRGRVIGAFGIDEKENKIEKRLKVFAAKTVILATGGAGEVFGIHVFPICMTGDGYAMAYRAGAELVNMEFIQIGLSSVKTRLACSGSMMRALPRFLNDEGQEFLRNYFPPETSLKEIYNLVFEKGASWPVSVEKKTHLIDVAVSKEMTKGYRVFLDYNANPRNFRFLDLKALWQERYKREIKNKQRDQERDKSPLHRLEEINPSSIQWLKEYGIDLHAGGRIEIAPAVQHFQGGVKIRERANTSLKGLYAAGECAGGQHGANRPGGNALLDGQVFGRIAGREAALEAKSIRTAKEVSPSHITTYLARLKKITLGKKAAEVRREVHSIASQFAGVVRTEKGLKEGLKILGRLKREGFSPDEKGLIFALETRNLLDVAEMVFRACLSRKESRGPHLFFNHMEDPSPLPSQDSLWRRYIVIQNRKSKMGLSKRAPVGLPAKEQHDESRNPFFTH